MKQSPQARCKHQPPQPKTRRRKTLFPRRRESIPFLPNEVAPTLGGRLFASLDQRLIAGLLDLIAMILLYLALGLLLAVTARLGGFLDPLPLWALSLIQLYLPALAYGILTLRLYSASAGKRLLGIQVLRSDESRIGWARAVVRELVKLSPLLPVVLLMMALRNDNRGLHDILADTFVVHATPGIPASRIE